MPRSPGSLPSRSGAEVAPGAGACAEDDDDDYGDDDGDDDAFDAGVELASAQSQVPPQAGTSDRSSTATVTVGKIRKGSRNKKRSKIILLFQARMRTYSLMNEDEDEDDRNRRLEQEARTKQLRVSLHRLSSPAKEGERVARTTDRRTKEKEEKKIADNDRRITETRAALPPCPYCSKTFSAKWNLVKHIK